MRAMESGGSQGSTGSHPNNKGHPSPSVVSPNASIHIIEDDTAYRKLLQRLFDSVHRKHFLYPCAEDFLRAYDPESPGCIITDVRLPGMSGLDLLDQLNKLPYAPPVIFLTAYGTVCMSAQTIKAGAHDFLEKPVSEQVLLDCVHRALLRDAEQRREFAQRRAICERLDKLTRRESQVLRLVLKGLTNKQIAAECGVSDRTVEVHRSNIMHKMQASSLVDLVKMVLACGRNGYTD